LNSQVQVLILSFTFDGFLPGWAVLKPAGPFQNNLPNQSITAIGDNPPMTWLDSIKWDDKGLVPVIAQEAATGDVLMFAWMDRAALQQTADTGQAVYFSRSRAKLWHKGEESGHTQTVHAIRTDCDSDVVLLSVTQNGHVPPIACHTGRHSCFFNLYQPGSGWVQTEPVLKDPATIYN
jgi:phosphoribosyl-AMP cyclohydrolase